jgi:lipopolysaccharide export system protein LptC
MQEGMTTPRWQATSRRPAVTHVSARRSRFVGLMKFVLPLGAAILLVLVVVWSGTGTRDEGFQLSFVSGGADGSPTPGMVKARYSGTDSKDRPFTITADRATQRPEEPEAIDLDALQADITLADGTWLALTASSGVYRREAQTLRLEGPVNVFSDDGFKFDAESADIDLASGTVESDRPVRGQGPLGLLNANTFRAVGEGRRLFFTGAVKLVVLPGGGG